MHKGIDFSIIFKTSFNYFIYYKIFNTYFILLKDQLIEFFSLKIVKKLSGATFV
jgi:hypothetical protein